MPRATVLSLALIPCLAAGAAAASGPLFEESAVFVGGQDGIHTYRIPSVVCTRRGTVLVFCEGRRDRMDDGTPTHLVLKRRMGNSGAAEQSLVRSMSWQPIQILIPSHGTEAYMNPVPVIDASTQAIFLLVSRFTRFGKEEDEGRGGVQTLLLKSRDEGATWSDPVDLTPSVGRVALGPGVAIQTRQGTLIAPTYAGVIYSSDHGETWKAGEEASGPLDEAQIVELADGSLLRNLRGTPYRTVYISQDGGRTWGAPHQDLALTDPEDWGGCQASLIRFTRVDDGYARNRLLFANPADLQHRLNLTVRMSYDEGKTWPVAKLVRAGTGSYSSMTVFPDGTLGLVYETGSVHGQTVNYNEGLTFVHFNLEWLTDGKDSLSQTSRK